MGRTVAGEPHAETPGLVLRTVPHPAEGSEVQAFGDWEAACAHLRDHLLTAPECHAWALVVPACAGVVDLEDTDARWAYAREALTTAGASAQALYDLYAGAVAADLRDAAALGWHCSAGAVTVALGTSGVLAVLVKCLRTAFLPGQGDARATAAARAEDQARPGDRRRERGMRSGPAGRGGREARAAAGREARWAPAEMLYYRVFRPAVQFVRSQHVAMRDLDGRPLRDYGRLKEVLPPLSRLKREDWESLRRQCGRG
jgi:hypothetical protein